MKRLVTAVVLLAAVLALCVGTQRQLDHLTDAFTQEIDRFCSYTLQNDTESALQTIIAVQADWEGSRALLGAVLPHSELDEIDRLFGTALQAAENGDMTECRMRAAELRTLLLHLPERELPKIENIL